MADGDNANEPWFPKSREDWVGAFADGIALDRDNRQKAEEARAEEEAKNGQNNGGEGSGDQRPKSWAERVLGG